MGLEIGKKQFTISRKTFINERLINMEIADIYDCEGKTVPEPKRERIGKQISGSPIWISKTRIDLSHRICTLATSMVSDSKNEE